jgi:hypothetical protein
MPFCRRTRRRLPTCAGGLRGRRLRRAIYRGPSWPPAPGVFAGGRMSPGASRKSARYTYELVAPGAGDGVFAGPERHAGQLFDGAASCSWKAPWVKLLGAARG